MSYIAIPASGNNPVATIQVTRDSTTEHIQLINVTDQSANDAIGAPSTGVTPLAGGAAMLGFLSSIFRQLSAGSGAGQAIPIADTTASVSVAAATTSQIIAATSGKKIYICSLLLMANGSGTVQLVYGAGNTALSGAMAVTPETGVSAGSGLGAVLIVPAGNILSITTTGTATVQGWISYTVAA